MKTAVKSKFNSKTLSVCESCSPLREKEINQVDFKFYRKLFVVIIALSTILIFPESPRELENICERNNSKELCNVW